MDNNHNDICHAPAVNMEFYLEILSVYGMFYITMAQPRSMSFAMYGNYLAID